MERVEWLKQMRDKVEALYDRFSAQDSLETVEDGDVPDELTASAVYNYIPSLEQVRKWLEQEKLAIEAEGTGTFTWGSDDALTATYDHFVVRKR